MQEQRYTNEPKVTVKMGHGIGTIIDASFPVAGKYKATGYLTKARAGQRLLITGTSHKEIKHMESVIKRAAKGLGLTLQWRFAREVKLVPRYIHPEWTEVRDIEYQAWVLVKARAVVGATSEDKNMWLFDSVVGQLNREETEVGDFPSWVYSMGPEEVGREADLVTQAERDRWDTDRGPFALDEMFNDPTAMVQSLDEEI